VPRQAQNSTQCQYAENGRQCRRSGTGTPALCPAHRLLFQQGQQPSRGDAIFDALDTWFSGRKVSKKKIRAAIHDLHDIAGSFQQGQAPGMPPPPPPGRAPRPGPPPPVADDPRLAEAKRRFMAAKRVLGFAESEPITAEQVTARRKELARRYHPDRAGRDDIARKRLEEQMIQVNAAADELLASAA